MSDIKLAATVRSRAATELRDRILTGRLPRGARIDLDQLSKEFGISRTPVREALLELSYEGLVAVAPRTELLDELRSLAAAIPGAADVVAANQRFHRALNLASGSPRLLLHLRQAVRVVPASYFELFPEQEQRSEREHAELLDAMGRGDAAEARVIAEAHVLDAGETLRDWLAAHETAG